MNLISDRVQALREQMKQFKISAYIIPSTDPHNSEYVAEHWQGREWISGFTGSSGTVVITENDGGLWTDGRYFIQAEQQLEDSGIRLFKDQTQAVPTFMEWLAETLKKEARVGFDGSVVTIAQTRKMEESFKEKNIQIVSEHDLLDLIWENRPTLPNKKIFLHDEKFAGKSSQQKLEELREEMKKQKVDHHLITTLDDIAWLYNFRGDDVSFCPVAIANAIVSLDQAYLFIDPMKASQEIVKKLMAEGITIQPYNEIGLILNNLPDGDSILISPQNLNQKLHHQIPEKINIVEGRHLTTLMKAVKNPIEIAHYKECLRRDGVAMVQFMKWLDETVPMGTVTELSAEKQLAAFRRQQEHFFDLSFNTIAGYKEHGAMMHYAATAKTDVTISNEGFFLVDSGGLYFDGTTDITRTFNYGPLSEAEKKDYTLVARGNISLAKAKFKKDSRGMNLDVLARAPMWAEGIDYGCGTGHGVGFFLNVHEGPQNLSQKLVDVPLVPGMVITNEPGIYRAGKHGIRIENIMLVVEDEKNEFGEFHRFETITLAPINTKPIIKEMMTGNEIQWLNDYHQRVYNELSPRLNEEENKWLFENTKVI